MKGVILAGGTGTRLLPITKQVNKHLVPILNRPMIMYPIETLKHFGITDIMIVSGGGHVGGFADFLGDGSDFDVQLTYRAQKEAGGIAQALGLAEQFVGSDKVVVILGDNVFDNPAIQIRDLPKNDAAIFCKQVPNMTRFGVLRQDVPGFSIVEKPSTILDSDTAVTGLYVYPNDVFSVIKTLKPSPRGELEITDVNNYYLKNVRCQINFLKPDAFWSDAGTPESLYKAIKYVAEKQGF